MTEGVETKTVYVVSDVDIEVHVSNEGNISPYYVVDAVEAQAISDVDTEHYVINYGDGFNGCPGYTAFYTVAALNSGTNVTIYQRSASGGGMEVREQVSLGRFQCFSERADISGTEPNGDGFRVVSSAPVVLYSGNRCVGEGGFVQGSQEARGRHGQVVHAHAGSVFDGVCDGSHGWNDGDFAHASYPKRVTGVGDLDDDGVDHGEV